MRGTGARERQNWISWVYVAAWMAVIFLFSAQEASDSSRLSSGLLQWVLSWLPFLKNGDPELGHLFIRKGAHFFIYAVLGVLSLRALFYSGFKGKKSWLLALLICVLYAASDELHQTFIPGRAGQIADVLLDGLGASTGIALMQMVRYGKQ